MKKNILFLVVSLFFLVGCDTFDAPITTTVVRTPLEQNTSTEGNISLEDTNRTEQTPKKIFLFPVTSSKIFSDSKCSQVIRKETYTTCYDYGLKSLTLNKYTLDGDLVYLNNIEERPLFYSEPTIPLEYRSIYSDFNGNFIDRGHFRTDASTDYDLAHLEETYSLGGNIVAQYSVLNRDIWVKVEKYSRHLASQKGFITVVNIAEYTTSPPRIGANKIAVPSGFYKVLYEGDGLEDDFKRCFYYDNKIYTDAFASNDTMDNHEVNCTTVKIDAYKTR